LNCKKILLELILILYFLWLQHESATRAIDINVWEEIRNFKKCLLKMFAQQGKDVIFIETVICLAKQRRHCMIECIPVPCEVSDKAPMYFKKVSFLLLSSLLRVIPSVVHEVLMKVVLCISGN
jgi:hypothetical protein